MTSLNKDIKINNSNIMIENTHTHNHLISVYGDGKTSDNYYGDWNLFGKIFNIDKLENNQSFVAKLNLFIPYTISKTGKTISVFINILKQNDIINVDYWCENLSLNKKELPLVVDGNNISLYFNAKNINQCAYIQKEYIRCNSDFIVDNLFKDTSCYELSLTGKTVYYPKPIGNFIETVKDINDLGNYKWDDSVVGRIAIQESKSLNSQSLKIAIKNSENATIYENIQLARSCITYYRPKDNLTVGTSVFDITLGKPIWCKSVTEYESDGVTVKKSAVWVDALGTEV